MDRTRIKVILSFCFIVLFSWTIFSQVKELPRPFNPPRLVNDYVNLLTTAENQTLERRLVAYSDSTSIQIAVIIEATTGGENIMTYAQRLSEDWGIGHEDRDNGILLLVTTEDRELRIHPGYGAEAFLTDNMSNRIINQVLVPSFKSEQYYEGLYKATDIIMKLGTGEYQALERKGRENGIPPELIFIIVLMSIAVISAVKNKDRWDDGDDGGYYRGGRYEDYGRGRRRGGWVVTGGGGFGGSSGGGFGGFGGGSFGGGGASGSW